jgi:hypothetical protein
MLFKTPTNWASIEADLRELDFKREEIIFVRKLWYRLQIENLVKGLTMDELEDALNTVAEEYDSRE